MSKRGYYYLVAGLPDLVLEQDAKKFDFNSLAEEVYEQARRHEHDYKSVRQFLSPREQNTENPDWNWAEFYHEIAEHSTNRFVRLWFEFDHLLRNIQSAWTCRKLGLSVQQQVVGLEEEIAYFVNNNLPDFGLRRELLLGEKIFNLLDEDIDLLEREFRFDQIRWEMADELTIFNYFELDNALAFLAKADILERWLKLDKERGAALFNGFVKTLVEQKSIEI